MLYEIDTVNCSYDAGGNLIETESYNPIVGQVSYYGSEYGSHALNQDKLNDFKKDFMPIREIVVNQNLNQDLGMQE